MNASAAEKNYTLSLAFRSLQDCRRSILVARVDALTAAIRLHGARAARSRELADKLGDALAHVEHLTVVVEGDLRAEEVEGSLSDAHHYEAS
jgi:hypothetical protein